LEYRADVASRYRPSAAEEARTIAAGTNAGTLATLSSAGEPWASFVTYGLLNGAPVLCVSNLAEHGRNLLADHRASISIVAPGPDPDPQSWGRVTLAGCVERPVGDELAAARDAHLAAVPGAQNYIDFGDFALWVLRVQRVRWYGGYGRMDVVTGDAYSAAAPHPISPRSAGTATDPI
jgi:putative heme iron utilization protein